KAEGFLPGGASLHNCMTAHGPDAETHERATNAELKPHKLTDTMAFMFESRFAMRLTRYAIESAELQHDYFVGRQGRTRRFPWRGAFRGSDKNRSIVMPRESGASSLRMR